MSAARAELPAGLTLLRRTPVFDQSTIPPGLRRNHRTAAGVWGVIRVVDGRLLYRTIEPAAERVLDPQHSAVIRPAQMHEVAPLGAVRFFVEFFADPLREKTSAGPPARPDRDACRTDDFAIARALTRWRGVARRARSGRSGYVIVGMSGLVALAADRLALVAHDASLMLGLEWAGLRGSHTRWRTRRRT